MGTSGGWFVNEYVPGSVLISLRPLLWITLPAKFSYQLMFIITTVLYVMAIIVIVTLTREVFVKGEIRALEA